MKLGEGVLRGDTELLRELVYADLGHISPVSVRAEPGVDRLLLAAGLVVLEAVGGAEQLVHRYALMGRGLIGFPSDF
ncbi:hypothetical protein [Sinomonas terrae]|uniref:Uncharacterized protein n=1 Tax=Sinomonas terrae TaxID=2908838 RepID=A0ABS9U2K5_9MICC|nr:hypothetical protein [Sinomonas terrae]MCH6470931.1 hypothetical protein [Sinomonas terrae]